MRGLGVGREERGGWERGDLEGRVLRLWWDLERGCAGGVWVRGVGSGEEGK